MIRKILFSVLALALCLIVTKNAIARNGVNATITSGLLLNDDINGLDYLVGHTSTLTYTIQIESDVSITGATLGFVLYSPDGSLTNIFWNSIPTAVGPWGDSTTWNFTGPQLRAGSDEFNGSLPSNWMTGGLAFLGAGYGPTELADALRFTIRLPGVEGGVLCLDSAFQPPAGEWLLAPANGGDGAAEWLGGGGDITVGGTRTNALCITTSSISSVTPCPNNATINHCEILSYRAFGEAPNSANPSVVYSVTHTGTGEAFIDTLGNVLYQPGAGEIGSISITANASDTDGSSVDCITFVDLTSNAPTIGCPPDFSTIRGKRSVSLPANGVDVDNCDALTYSLVSVSPTPIGTVSVDPSTGAVTFDSDEADAVGNADTDYTVCIAVSDGFFSDQCCMTFTVLEEEVFSISIEQTDKIPPGGSFQGEETTVCINYEGGSSDIGGFDFLISYDPVALSIVTVTEGNIFADYEW